MIEDVRGALRILGHALALEKDGRTFYRKAGQTTQDEKGQAIFDTFSEEENKHYGLIKRQQESLRRASKWLTSAEVAPIKST